MISEFKSIAGLFEELDKIIEGKMNIWIIGGAALLYQGIKSATKAIDIIVKSKEDFLKLQKALLKAGFNKNRIGIEYKNMNLSYVFIREDFRIDIFLEKVCSKFLLSEDMIKRAKNILSLRNISLFNCSNEDIFLFKSMTDRQGDLEDCLALSRKNLNWNIIKEELFNQIKISGKDIWITWIGERFDIFVDNGIDIPIMKDIDKLREDYFRVLEKDLRKKGLLEKT
jgi:hypothetical protein